MAAEPAGGSGAGVAPFVPTGTLSIVWLGAFFALSVVLLGMASIDATRDFAVALAWLAAVASAEYAITSGALSGTGGTPSGQ